VPRYSLGIDIGGTFTDLVVHDHETGHAWSRKVLTTHDDPARAVAAGVAGLLRGLRDVAADPARVTRVVHATTLFTNALIERQGAPTGLITTEGFADTLEIGRERKFELYDIDIEKPEPLVPRHRRLEVRERVRADGRVMTKLDLRQVDARARRLVAAGVTSIAIVFLHAYANPRHEAQAAARIARRFRGVAVTASHEVASEIREFERASTAVANAYIKPLARRYLDLMARRLRALGVPAPLLLMLSSGGLTHVAEAERTPVQMLESGPAAGAIAAAFFGAEDKLLAFDMGGTTAKLSLVEHGEPLTAYSFEAARQRRFIEGSGLPIRISTIELIEIGAGGGSIASVDEIGLLKVGPRSAGSHPGPAAYGLGGVEATVTDADFLLGYLNPAYFAGGEVKVDLDAARAAVDRVAARVGLSREAVAWGIHEIVNENMAGAARVHVAERGRDPRDYALLCTGGAGPVHAYSVARKLGLTRVICPPSAGVASALGLLLAPARVDRVATVGLRLDRDRLGVLEAAFRTLEDGARAVMADTGLPLETASVQRLADGRFLGQGFDLVVALPVGPYADDEATRRTLQDAFERAYLEKFALTPPNVPVEFINIRVAVRAPVSGGGVGVLKSETTRSGSAPATKGTRRAYFPGAGGWVETTVYDRAALVAEFELSGPAVVEEEGSTLVVGPGARVRVAPNGNLVMTMTGA
jgi:N-methylhydantoinase A